MLNLDACSFGPRFALTIIDSSYLSLVISMDLHGLLVTGSTLDRLSSQSSMVHCEGLAKSTQTALVVEAMSGITQDA